MYTHVRKSNKYLSSSYCFCILEQHLCDALCDGTCNKIFRKLCGDADQTEHLDSSEQPPGQQQGHISYTDTVPSAKGWLLIVSVTFIRCTAVL